jgi:hypothetical protein
MRHGKNLFQNSVHLLRIVRRHPSQGWWCFCDSGRVHGLVHLVSTGMQGPPYSASRQAILQVSLIVHHQMDINSNVSHNRM